MKNDNFYKTLRIVCLILAIVCMALSLFKKAKAAEAETVSDFSNYIYDIYNSCSTTTTYTDSYMIEVLQNAKNFVHLYNESEHILVFGNKDYLTTYYGLYYGLDTNNHKVNGNNSIGYKLPKFPRPYSGSSWAEYYVKNPYPNIDECIVYYIYLNSNEIICSKVLRHGTSNFSSITNTPDYSVSRFNDKYTLNNNDGTYSLLNQTGETNNVITDYVCFGNNCYGQYNGSTYCYNLPSYYTNDMLNPPSVNTDGFQVYKYGASGSERLVCDFSECISISPAVANSSTIKIDININGVDQTFNFDSSTTYYDYSVSGWRALYSFPFTIFNINSETISAKLIEVKIVNTTSSPGGSYTKDIIWVTPLTLIGSDYEDLEPEVIPKEQMPDFDKFDDEDTQTNYNSTINRWITSGSSSFDYSLYTRWNFEPKYYIVPVIYYGASQAAIDALKAALNLDFGQAIDDVIAITQGITIEDQIQEFMQENYYLNDLYDIIVFAYEASAGADTVYYIFTTDSYNNHLSNSFLYDVLQAIYDDGKAIEKTYDYLYDRLDDFEEKTLTKLNEMVGLQEMENGFFSSLQSILNQILNALLNLNIEVPEADYTDIIDKLDTIIENQDTSDINDDWYQNYREWLYGINENDSYLSPHEYFNNIFGTLKTTFDSFTNNISFNAYLLKVEDFINHISGSTTDNLTIYLRDGIGDPGFNINNNYMYTVGGS